MSNPDIAEAVLITPDQVLVNGKAFGQVNFIAWEQTGGQFLCLTYMSAPTCR